MLNRRKFLRHAFLAAAGVSVSYAGQSTKLTPFAKVIRNILITDLKGLRVNLADIEAYAREAAKKNPLGFSFATTQMMELYQIPGVKRLPLPSNKRYAALRGQITGNFLLSTNFFQNKMDESKEIKYAGYIYEAHKGACANPFSGLYFQVK